MNKKQYVILYFLFVLSFIFLGVYTSYADLPSGEFIIQKIESKNIKDSQKCAAIKLLYNNKIKLSERQINFFIDYLIEHHERGAVEIYRAISFIFYPNYIKINNEQTMKLVKALLDGKVKRVQAELIAIAHILQKQGYFSIDIRRNLKHIIDESCSKNPDYAIAALPILRFRTSKEEKSKKLENDYLTLLEYYKYIVSLYKKTDYKLFLKSVKCKASFVGMTFVILKKEIGVGELCISLLCETLKSKTGNVQNILSFLNNLSCFFLINERYIPIIIDIVNSSKADTKCYIMALTILNNITYKNKRVDFSWKNWWAKHKTTFSRTKAAMNALVNNDLPDKIKLSAVWYLTCSTKTSAVKQLPDSILQGLKACSLHSDSQAIKDFIYSVMLEYNKKNPGNNIVNLILTSKE